MPLATIYDREDHTPQPVASDLARRAIGADMPIHGDFLTSIIAQRR